MNGGDKETAIQAKMVGSRLWGESFFEEMLRMAKTPGVDLPERSGSMFVSDWVKKHYPKTEDAAVVCYWFGGDVNSKAHFLMHFLLKGREPELLELARQLEREEKDKPKN